MTTAADDASEILRRGIRACREERWREGFDELTRLAREREAEGGLPGLFYSYLGQAIARCEGRKHEGLELCRHAVQVEPFRPENYLNLSQLYLMVGNRRAAIRAVRDGLALDSGHRGLAEMRVRLGIRQRPPIPFLPRTNPLNVALGRAKMIATGEERGDVARASAQIVAEQGAKMIRIIRQLLDFARRPVGTRVVTSIAPIVDRSFVLLAPLAGERRVALVRVPTAAGDHVSAEPMELEQVVTNLLTNAVQASPPQSTVRVRIDRGAATPPGEVPAAPGEYVQLAIEDPGVGIPAADLSRLFDPFFTTKPVGEGTGLGLSVAYGIVRDHGGWIQVESAEGAGSRFVVYLPAVEATCPTA